MSEAPLPQKPIPQFSLRWLLGVTAGCAGVFSIVALAMRGHVWAVGVSVGLCALVLLMLVHAALFALVWAWAAIVPSQPFREEWDSPQHAATDEAEKP